MGILIKSKEQRAKSKDIPLLSFGFNLFTDRFILVLDSKSLGSEMFHTPTRKNK